MAEYRLKPCTVNDAAALAKNNVSAFWEEEWWNLLWENRSRDSLIEALANRMPKNLLTDRHVRRHEMAVHIPSGEVVGYARWILPESHREEWLETQTADVCNDERARFAEAHSAADWTSRDLDDMDDPVYAMFRKHEPKGPYMSLDYLCTRPDHQRRGVAQMLVKAGIDKASELGLDISLVAMGRNALRMYEKLGFELREESVQELKKWGGTGLYETFMMVKGPRRHGGSDETP